MTRLMIAPPKMRGAVSVIVAVLFLVVIGIALAVALQSASSNFSDVSAQSDSADALYLAESGVERALYILGNLETCAALAPDPVTGTYSLGRGTFATTASSAVPIAPGQPLYGCDFSVIGKVGLSQRQINLRATYHPWEHFPSLTRYVGDWTYSNFTNLQGTMGFDNAATGCPVQTGGACNCPAATCPNTLTNSGVYFAMTDINVSNAILRGTVGRKLWSPIATGATGTSVNFWIAYSKYSLRGSADFHELRVRLYDSSRGITDEIWSDVVKGNIPWTYVNANVTNLIANRTYDWIYVYVYLNERNTGKRELAVYVDELRIDSVTTIASPTIQTWTEVVP